METPSLLHYIIIFNSCLEGLWVTWGRAHGEFHLGQCARECVDGWAVMLIYVDNELFKDLECSVISGLSFVPEMRGKMVICWN